MSCKHCGGATPETHPGEHPGLCCDCFDLALGMPLEQLNDERAEKGRPPLRPWKCDRRIALEDQAREAGGHLVEIASCDWGAMTVADIERQHASRGASVCTVHEALPDET